MTPSEEIWRSKCIDIARAANLRIRDFIHQSATINLRPGTGFYSTPFRGGLFGQVMGAKVAKQLSVSTVDALWLGTNPCVQRSLDNIINQSQDDGDFPGFEKQVDSGFFGSCKWQLDGTPRADFNPIERPTGSWSVYLDLFEQFGSLDRVAMANFIPWGSKTTEVLINQLGAANRPLLQRVLEFADDLNVQIVEALEPRLVVVSFSLGRNRKLRAVGPVGVSLQQTRDARPFAIRLPEGSFKFYTGVCQRGRLSVRTLFVRHPASLRLSNESKKRVVSEVAQTLLDFDEGSQRN